jgi:hypothetical protein
MISLYNNLLYDLNLWIFCFYYSCCMHLLNSLYSLPIGSLLCVHGLSFHFYLYSVREKDTFHFENLINLSLFFILLQFVVQFQTHVEVYHQW